MTEKLIFIALVSIFLGCKEKAFEESPRQHDRALDDALDCVPDDKNETHARYRDTILHGGTFDVLRSAWRTEPEVARCLAQPAWQFTVDRFPHAWNFGREMVEVCREDAELAQRLLQDIAPLEVNASLCSTLREKQERVRCRLCLGGANNECP